ncbi:hypothetical protein [uncultured Paludibaculum sp.]|uniref:hypothetical protein n=1 Tax=uncultured Paludibaculum sp. TaxID=1765020 RepID=UPI002AABE4EE|nr:hypothetical protein [uncultured Paludibaculum sp.]
MLRIIGLAGLGIVLPFAGLTLYVVLLGPLLKQTGIPPDAWFGSDYVDRRCAVVSSAVELLVLSASSYAVGGLLSRHGQCSPRMDAFWMCNPASSLAGLLFARQIARNLEPYEFVAGVVYLWPFAWLVTWHLTVLGMRRTEWARAVLLTVAYSATLGAAGVYLAYRSFQFE